MKKTLCSTDSKKEGVMKIERAMTFKIASSSIVIYTVRGVVGITMSQETKQILEVVRRRRDQRLAHDPQVAVGLVSRKTARKMKSPYRRI